MRIVRVALIAVLGVGSLPLHQSSLGQAREARRAEGVVLRGTASGPRPIDGIHVVLHRVGPDRAGPLDSTVTDRGGRYAFRYTTSGDSDAVYLISASYQGIAYFASPLRAPVVRGDDATITVFDTSSGPLPVHLLGHHVLIGTPDGRGRREVVEIFELGNDSSVTLVSGGRNKPVWSARLPPGAVEPRVNPSGEIAPGAVSFAGDSVRLYAPLVPGARQLSYAYQLPRNAVPLTIPIVQPTSVLELLVEEPRAIVSGARLSEVAAATTAGRTFRRFLSQEAPVGSALRVEFPAGVAELRARVFAVLAASGGAAMVVALVFANRRTRRRASAIRHARPISEQLL
ncbi:MAG TPA: hypothetical protein VE714_06165, partial [Gemmatimonadales bacterium]|nr:hypothetical protein [Gemmatimonadales bacterium]